MNQLTKIIVPAITALALMTNTAYAGKDGDYKNCSADKKVEKLTKKLDLNEEQQQLLKEFAEAKHSMRETRKESRQNNSDAFEALAEKETLEVDDITGLMEEKSEERKAAMQPVLEKFVAFRNSLNEEQRAESQGMLRNLLTGGRGYKKRWNKQQDKS